MIQNRQLILPDPLYSSDNLLNVLHRFFQERCFFKSEQRTALFYWHILSVRDQFSLEIPDIIR